MRLGRRGTAALEFGLVAPVLLVLMFGSFEAARFFWTWQALQRAGDQTARCVAIGSPACPVPSAYAVTAARNFGAALDPSGIAVATVSAGASACAPPPGNSATQVQITVAFTSPLLLLLPFLSHDLTTISCYPLTGK